MGRYRFVNPAVTRYDLSEGDWVEFKDYLNAGETKQLAGAGVPSMTPGDKGPQSFALDFKALGLARLEMYAHAWSLVDAKGNQTRPDRDTISQLDPRDFDEIDAVLDRHVKEMAERKKAPTPAPAGATN